MELSEISLAVEVWLTSVPIVAWGGLVVPMVPVATTPSGNDEEDCADEPAASASKARGRDMIRGGKRV